MPYADVVIMGGGLAGLVAANRAIELGLSVIVLEASPYPFHLCDSRYSRGLIHLCGLSPKSDVETIVSRVVASTGGSANEPLARAFASNAGRAVDWLAEHGGAYEPGRYQLAPERGRTLGVAWEELGADLALQHLTESLLHKGGHLVLDAHVDKLTTNAGKVTGFLATWDEEPVIYNGKVTLIADGGFGGNRELIGRYISKEPDTLVLGNSESALGTGLRMAAAAGAKLVGMQYFHGSLVSRDAREIPDLWPYPAMDALATAGIVVDGNGERLADEGRGGVFMANQIAATPDPLDYWCVFDDATWATTGNPLSTNAASYDSPNPDLEAYKGTVLRSDSIEELAKKARMPADKLSTTVDAYNAALANDGFDGLTAPRSDATKSARPIANAPFYAVPLAVCLTKTMGGPAVDEHCRVMREDGSVIDGLYVIGAAMGGLEGGEPVGSFGGLAQALIGGLIALEHAAASKAAGW